jgi:CheY-like chemotaxis protein
MEGDRELYLQAEMDDYLSKPFQKEAFLALLDKWLEKDQ